MRVHFFPIQRWRWLVAFVGVLVLLIAPHMSPSIASQLALAQGKSEPASPDEVYRSLGIDAVSADYLLLIDTSASMSQGGRYAAVLSSVRDFLTALAPDDRVELIPFDEKVHDEWVGKVGRSPGALMSHLPKSATGRYTDMGLAIERAVRRLAEPGSAQIATIVLFTDGKHDPNPNSPYPSTSGYAWKALTAVARNLHKESVRAYSIPLRTGETGATQLQTVFGNRAQVLRGDVNEITSRLDKPKQESRAAKARSVLGDDYKQGVRVEWPANILRSLDGRTREITVSLSASTKKIPLVLTRIEGQSIRPDLTVRPSTSEVALAPGERFNLPVTVRWTPPGRSPWPRSITRLDGVITLNAQIDSPWANVLHKTLGLAFTPHLVDASTSVHGIANQGRPGEWATAAVLAVALLVMIAVILSRRANPNLFGQLIAESFAGDRQYGKMRLRGRRIKLPTRSLDVPGNGSIRARRVRLVGGGQATVVEISYSPDGSEERRLVETLGLNDEKIINSVRFRWTNATNGNRAIPIPRPVRRPPVGFTSEPEPEWSPPPARPSAFETSTKDTTALGNPTAPRPVDPETSNGDNQFPQR